jgi:glutamyl/glutaminyl-tRNA synthetase
MKVMLTRLMLSELENKLNKSYGLTDIEKGHIDHKIPNLLSLSRWSLQQPT